MCYALVFLAVVSLLQEGADWFGFGFLKTWVCFGLRQNVSEDVLFCVTMSFKIV